WRCTVTFDSNRLHEYTFIAWRDLFATWRKDTAKKFAAGLDVELEVEEGRRLLEAAIEQEREDGRAVAAADIRALTELLSACDSSRSGQHRLAMLRSEDTAALMQRAAPRANLSQYERILNVFADRRAAAFSAWYELLPRSQSGDAD